MNYNKDYIYNYKGNINQANFLNSLTPKHGKIDFYLVTDSTDLYSVISAFKYSRHSKCFAKYSKSPHRCQSVSSV